MSFLNKLLSKGKNPSVLSGELELLNATPLWYYLLFSFSGGLLFSVALPPLNLSFAGFAALAPLVWCAHRLEWKRAALCGWVWGLVLCCLGAFASREIHRLADNCRAAIKDLIGRFLV